MKLTRLGQILFASLFIVTMTSTCSPAASLPEVLPVQITTLHLRNDSANRAITVQLWIPAHCGRYPLLLFFPGWGAEGRENRTLLRSLAEDGYVVAGVSYPTGTDVPDPKIPMQFAPDAAYAAGLHQGNRMVHLQAEDASTVLTQLLQAGETRTGPLLHRLQSTMIGVLGYSLGGAVAAQTALDDPRVRAVMNLDGWMFGDPVTRNFGQPYLVISDGLPPPTPAELQSSDTFLRNFSGLRASDRKIQDAQLKHSGGYRITIAGTDHFTFSEKMAPKPGELQPRRAAEITAAYASAFFGKHLKHESAPLLDGRGSRFAEAHLEVFS